MSLIQNVQYMMQDMDCADQYNACVLQKIGC